MSGTKTESNFGDLLKALGAQAQEAEALAAKKPNDDAAVAAAAAEAGAAGAAGAAGGEAGEGGEGGEGNPEDADDDLAKSLAAAGLVDATDLLKSLEAQKAGGEGEGEGGGKITPAELLAKSNAAHDAGKISGVELTTVDVCLRNGWAIDASILHKVAAASAS